MTMWFVPLFNESESSSIKHTISLALEHFPFSLKIIHIPAYSLDGEKLRTVSNVYTVQSRFSDTKFSYNLWISDYFAKTIFQFTAKNHSI